MITSMPVCMDYGAELTYPVGESYSSGILNNAAQVFGIVFTLVSSILIQKNGKTGTNESYIMMSGSLFLFSVLLSFFLPKGQLKRLEAEKIY